MSTSSSARSLFAILSLGLGRVLLAMLSCKPETSTFFVCLVYIFDTITLRIPAVQACREAFYKDEACVSKPHNPLMDA